MILTRKSHNCAGTAFVQEDSAGGSKLIEQTLQNCPITLSSFSDSEFLQLSFLPTRDYLNTSYIKISQSYNVFKPRKCMKECDNININGV